METAFHLSIDSWMSVGAATWAATSTTPRGTEPLFDFRADVTQAWTERPGEPGAAPG